ASRKNFDRSSACGGWRGTCTHGRNDIPTRGDAMSRRSFLSRSITVALAGAFAATVASGAAAQGKEIRIAHVYSKTGPLEAYGKQTAIGLQLGFEYATGATMTVNGRKLVVI